MKEFETNQYIELYDPFKSRYLPVRILKKNTDGYLVKFISIEKEINIYEYQLNNYGYRELWNSRELLEFLEFKKDGLKNQLGSLIVWECLLGELKNNGNNNFIYEYSSKFLGYALLQENSFDEFEKDFAKLNYNSDSTEFEKKYLISSSVNQLFNYLKDINPDKYNIEKIDKIVKEYRRI